MTTEVVAVREDTPFKDVVALLREHRVGAMPVFNCVDRVVGVVSASDLLLKQEDAAALAGGGRHGVNPIGRAGRRRAGATVAGDVMTAPAVVVSETWEVPEAARLMHAEHVSHLPVIDFLTGKLRGIVSRSDLLSVFLRPDDALAREVRAALADGGLGGEPVTVGVRHGVVTLRGRVGHARDAGLAVRAALRVEGVVKVVDQLTTS